jgi:hypothetical protein
MYSTRTGNINSLINSCIPLWSALHQERPAGLDHRVRHLCAGAALSSVPSMFGKLPGSSLWFWIFSAMFDGIATFFMLITVWEYFLFPNQS